MLGPKQHRLIIPHYWPRSVEQCYYSVLFVHQQENDVVLNSRSTICIFGVGTTLT